jgi:hypothetical protein
MATFFAEHLLGNPTPEMEMEDISDTPSVAEPVEAAEGDAE